jgi:hypothetical protein
MAARYILAAFAVAFLTAAAIRLYGGGSVRHPQARTWLLVGVIFAAISAWLFL